MYSRVWFIAVPCDSRGAVGPGRCVRPAFRWQISWTAMLEKEDLKKRSNKDWALRFEILDCGRNKCTNICHLDDEKYLFFVRR